MRIYLLTSVLALFFFESNSQNIQIGQDAEQVKSLVEWSTAKNQKDKLLNQTDSYWSWDRKYNNGNLTEVIQCFQNQYLIDFQIKADYCERYMMMNGKLKYTIKEFENLSLDKTKEFYITKDYAKYKIDDLYFSDNFQFYYKFYLSKNNLASVELHKVELEDLPKEIMAKLESKRNNVNKEKLIEQNEKDSLRQTVSVTERKVLYKATPKYNCNDEGLVVVEVSVDKSGKATKAIPGVYGTTTQSKCLLEASKIAALQTRWEIKGDASEEQKVKISYRFKF